MVIIKLKGGLGNQMFQYACARHLAQKNADTAKLDLGWYHGNIPAGDTVRTYGLDAFAISAQPASEDDLKRVKGRGSFVVGLIKKVIRKMCPIASYTFMPSILEQRGNVYLDGYFQSERYFKDIEPIIRNEFQLKSPMGDAAQEILRDIEQSDSVSLHIRRGDYVTNKHANAFHGTCSSEYYHSAIAAVERVVRSPKFFIFSDDIEWAKSDIGMPSHAVFVSRKEISDVEELVLMSKCKHNIIANSSFSWWGAWLNEYKQKMVVAPKHWVNDPKVNTADAVPAEWTRI